MRKDQVLCTQSFNFLGSITIKAVDKPSAIAAAAAIDRQRFSPAQAGRCEIDNMLSLLHSGTTESWFSTRKSSVSPDAEDD